MGGGLDGWMPASGNLRRFWTCQALAVIVGRVAVVLLKEIGGRLMVSGLVR
jgi:hypothetical protein